MVKLVSAFFYLDDFIVVALAVFVALFLVALNYRILRTRVVPVYLQKPTASTGRQLQILLLIVTYFAVTIGAFSILYMARTDILSSPWTVLDNTFLLLIASGGAILFIICIRSRKESLGLLLTAIQAFLARSLIGIVLSPQCYGDNPWYDLAFSTALQDNLPIVGHMFNLPNLMGNSGYQFGNIIVFFEKSMRYASSVLISDLSGTPLLLAHVWIVPIVSSLFMTAAIFGIARELSPARENSSALVTSLLAVLTISTVFYGGYPWANGLGVALFAITLYVWFLWLKTDQTKYALAGSVLAMATALAHDITGIYAAVVVGLSIAFHLYLYSKRRRGIRILFSTVITLLTIALEPISFLLYYRSTSFGLENLPSLSVFLASIAQFLTQDPKTPDTIAWLAGSIFVLVSFGGFCVFLLSRRCSPFRFDVSYILPAIASVAFVNYVVNVTLAANSPFTSEREHIFIYLCLMPFCVYVVSRALTGTNLEAILHNSERQLAVINLRVITSFLLLLLVVFMAVTGVLYAYPRIENKWGRVTMLEYQSALLLNATYDSPYAVIADFNFRLAGSGAMGYLNPSSFYLEPYSSEADRFYELALSDTEAGVSAFLNYSIAHIQDTMHLARNFSRVFMVLSSYRFDVEEYFYHEVFLQSHYSVAIQQNDGQGNEVLIYDVTLQADQPSGAVKTWYRISGEWTVKEDVLSCATPLEGYRTDNVLLYSLFAENFSIRFTIQLSETASDFMSDAGFVFDWKSAVDFKMLQVWFISNSEIFIRLLVSQNGSLVSYPAWPGIKSGQKWNPNGSISLSAIKVGTQLQVFLDEKETFEFEAYDKGGLVGLTAYGIQADFSHFQVLPM